MPACGDCDAPGCMCACLLPAGLLLFGALVPGPAWPYRVRIPDRKPLHCP